MFTKKIASALVTALVAGVALSSAITPASADSYGYKKKSYDSDYSAPRGDYWNKHVRWCYDHHRSYRESRNEYKTYSGYWKVCTSPYWHG